MKIGYLLLLALFTGCANQSADEEADRQAQSSLGLVQDLHSSAVNKHAPPVASSAALGDGFPVYLVRLDELKAFSAQTAPEALLHESNERFYAVHEAGRVVSSTTLRLTPDGWQPSEVGRTGLASRLHQTRLALRRQRSADADAYALVRVPALGAEFIMHREHGAVWLTAFSSGEEAKPRLAAVAFAELSKQAQSIAN